MSLTPAMPPANDPTGWDGLLAGLENLSQGFALLDARSQLHYANRSAREGFQRLGWILHDGCVMAPVQDDQQRWLSVLQSVCLAGRRALHELTGSGPSAYAALSPVGAPGNGRAFLAFGRPELCGDREMQLYAARRGLTQAETLVMAKLASGLKPAEIARAHGVAISTVLTQVASIRAKTSSATVSQLMRTLSLLPPLSGPGR